MEELGVGQICRWPGEVYATKLPSEGGSCSSGLFGKDRQLTGGGAGNRSSIAVDCNVDIERGGRNRDGND